MQILGWWRFLRWGYKIPFRAAPSRPRNPSLTHLTVPLPSGAKPWRRKCSLVKKGAVEFAPLPSPGFYSRLFVVMKASGSWRPVIDLSLLNLKVLKTSFKMETLQSVLLSVQRGDWMVSLDLKDAYFQVTVHPDSRKYLRFVAFGQVYQFKALCFGLSTAPQVSTRVMALVSAFLHRAGIRIRRYLDDWLIQAASRSQVMSALDAVLHLCQSLGIVVNWEKSHLVPAQQMIYLGVLLDSQSFRASPAQKRVVKLLSIGDEFLSCEEQPASSWLELLRVLSSMIPLVLGGRLRMRLSSAPTSSILGSPRPVNPGVVDLGLSARSRVVVGAISSGRGRIPVSGVPQPRLLVRRLGRGLGGLI